MQAAFFSVPSFELHQLTHILVLSDAAFAAPVARNSVAMLVRSSFFIVTALFFVQRGDRAQVLHRECAKRRSLLKLTKYTDALLIRGNILGHETARHILRLGPKIAPSPACAVSLPLLQGTARLRELLGKPFSRVLS